MSTLRRVSWLVIFAAFLAGAGFEIRSAQQCYDTKQCAGHKHFTYEAVHGGQEKSFWEWTSHDPVALYTFWLAIFTFCLVLVSATQIRYLIRADETARTSAEAALTTARTAIEQAAHMERSVAVTKDIADATKDNVDFLHDSLRATQRPWVSADVIPTSDFFIGEEGRCLLTINILVKNHGNIPALGIFARTRLLLNADRNSIIPTQNEMSRFLKDAENVTDPWGQSLFPNQETIMFDELHATDAVPITDDSRRSKFDAQFIQGYIVGCVGYMLPFGGRGETRFSYIIAKNQPSNMIIADVGNAIERRDRRVPRDVLVLARSNIGNGAE